MHTDDTPLQPETPELIAALLDNRQRFLAFLESRLGDRAIAEDILQDAFVRGLRAVDSLQSPDALLPWFYRVLRNAAIDWQRKRGTASQALQRFQNELGDDTASPEVRNQVCQCVARLAETLKPEFAEILTRVDVDEVAVKDYAVQVGISSNLAGVRVHRARAALLKRVQASCGACATHGCLDCSCPEAVIREQGTTSSP